METKIKGYKGFDKDLACRNKQYALGREEKEDVAELCCKGLHFCENPHDVFKYYVPGSGNRFCEVEAYEVDTEKSGDSKRVSKRLYVKTEISAARICKIAVSAFFKNFDFKAKIAAPDAINAGDNGAANAGAYGAANAGDSGAANAGNKGAANAGAYGVANAGNKGKASVKENGVAVASTGGKVKGGTGSVLVLVNRDRNFNIIDSAAAIVDGVTVLPDTWYRLYNGSFVLAEEEASGIDTE
jgi:hypothetical protein